MKLNGRSLITLLCALVFAFSMCAAAALAAETTVKGTVKAEGLVADDGTTYAIAAKDKGNELMKMTDKKVEVKGTVTEEGGNKTIDVKEYKEMK